MSSNTAAEFVRRSSRRLLSNTSSSRSGFKSAKTTVGTENSRSKGKKKPAETPSKHSSIKAAAVDGKTNVISGERVAEGYLDVAAEELDLERTLLGGQSFRWTKEIFANEQPDLEPTFTGVVSNHALAIWRDSPQRIAFRRLNKESRALKVSVTQLLLADYFQLHYNLKQLYTQWAENDEHFANCCEQYKGFRILRQDPVENVFSFICATNNNIKRISQMVDKLCRRFGNILEPADDLSPGGKGSVYDCYHSFPSVERLARNDVFECLRHELGFGYRAKFITGTAQRLIAINEHSGQSPRQYLMSLRKLPYKDTCKRLMEFPGIGRKVADCICLMSMDHLDAVPIDCHILDIVCRHYLPQLRRDHKTLTESVHDKIGAHFKELHKSLAGWSTSVLFVADLRHLKRSSDGLGYPSSQPPTKQKRKCKQE